jgi:hypothetical protein
MHMFPQVQHVAQHVAYAASTVAATLIMRASVEGSEYTDMCPPDSECEEGMCWAPSQKMRTCHRCVGCMQKNLSHVNAWQGQLTRSTPLLVMLDLQGSSVGRGGDGRCVPGNSASV